MGKMNFGYGRDKDFDDKKDKHDNKGPKGNDCNIWDCRGGFWGVSYERVVVEKHRDFKGNVFNLDLNEKQAIDANEAKGLGLDSRNTRISDKTVVTGEVVFEKALYNNTVGAFTVNAKGVITAAQLLVPNVNNGATFELDGGHGDKKLGFFLIADGWDTNAKYSNLDLANGELKFITNYGQANESLTKVTDNGANVSLVFTDKNGTDTVLQGEIRYSSERGGSNSLNEDGQVRVISGVDEHDSKTLKVAFEDGLDGRNDKDYNDAVFTVKLTDEVTVCKPVFNCEPPPCKPEPACGDIKNVISFNDTITNVVNNFIEHVSSNQNNINISNVNKVSGADMVASILNAYHPADDVQPTVHQG